MQHDAFLPGIDSLSCDNEALFKEVVVKYKAIVFDYRVF